VKHSSQFLAIGNQLLQGPRTIITAHDAHGWLEKDIAVYLHYFGHNRLHHISLWSDDTINREKNFLPPVIRLAQWERQQDVERFQAGEAVQWPSVTVSLGYIKAPFIHQLHIALLDIQQQVNSLQFAPMGLRRKRDVPCIPVSEQYIDFEIWMRNGAQSICYASPLLQADAFCKKVFELKQLLLSSMQPFDYTGWKEKYTTSFAKEWHYWNYETPA